MLTAYLLGTEVQWKLGEALVDGGDHYAKGWHSTCTVGVTLLRGRLGLDEVTDETVAAPQVQALVRKVKVYPDPSITVSHARVNIKVILKNGETHTEAYYPAKGAADNPLSLGELDEKFHECAQWGGVNKQKAARAIELVSSMERLDDCRDLMQCLVR
jgi:2-methylcitrate dehydratase PrpD